MAEHNHTGNCWDTPYECAACNGELCDVCHKHAQPRGECDTCDSCERCESQ